MRKTRAQQMTNSHLKRLMERGGANGFTMNDGSAREMQKDYETFRRPHPYYILEEGIEKRGDL
jgi:hypothetical protein